MRGMVTRKRRSCHFKPRRGCYSVSIIIPTITFMAVTFSKIIKSCVRPDSIFLIGFTENCLFIVIPTCPPLHTISKKTSNPDPSVSQSSILTISPRRCCRYRCNFSIYTHFDGALSFSVEPFRNIFYRKRWILIEMSINRKSALISATAAWCSGQYAGLQCLIHT